MPTPLTRSGNGILPMRKTGTPQPKSNTIVLHYWGRHGGGSQVTYHLARHLCGANCNSNVILSLAKQNKDMATFQASGLPIVTFNRPSLTDLWRKAWSLPRDLKIHADSLAALKPDAVIMTMNSPFAWPFIHLLQRRGLKVFYVAHDAEPHPGDYARLWQRATQDLLIRSADRVIALSGAVAKQISERIPAAASKTVTIPLETIYPTEATYRPETPAPHEPVRLLFYGRLLPYKGLDLLAQALEPLKSNRYWCITIAGSGPLEADVRRTFETWPQVALELGWINDQRTAELFSSHHALLCPYVEASQSGVVAQAMSWAMPCLVMPTGALPEQIGFGAAGIVSKTSDAEGFRQSLLSILEQPESLVRLSRGAAALLADRQRHQGWTTLIEAATSAEHRKLDQLT